MASPRVCSPFCANASAGANAEPELDRFFEDGLISDWQYAGQPHVDKAGLAVGRGTKLCGAAGEDFGLSVELCVDFKPDVYAMSAPKGDRRSQGNGFSLFSFQF